MVGRRRVLSGWRGGILVMLCLIVLGAGAAVVQAAGDSSQPAASALSPTAAPLRDPLLRVLPGIDGYLYRATGERADPVNLILWGVDTRTVVEAITRVLGWQPIEGSPMTFIDQGQPLLTTHHFGLPAGAGARLHLRLASPSHNGAETYVLAAVHRDDPAPCGHVGRAFNEARDLVAQAFAAAGYAVITVRRGNTDPGGHCDGSLTMGDGQIAVIRLGAE